MKILVLSPDIPYPANKGQRADIWRRILALSKLNCEISLVCFYDDASLNVLKPEHIQVIQEKTKNLLIFPIKRTIGGTIGRFLSVLFRKIPWHATSRTLSGIDLEKFSKYVDSVSPELIWLEGPWCGVNAIALVKEFNLPLYYRSHNIEHLYMQRQALAARRVRDRLMWNFSCLFLQEFERDLMLRSHHVYDISAHDMLFWESRGINNVSCLPPLPETELATDCLPPETELTDVVFLGNLTTPNNVRGIEFLITEVMPLVLKERPQTTLAIAGSNPGNHVLNLVSSCKSATLLQNVPDAVATMNSARVLVNPVRTGSGVMVKILDMLMTSAPIVSSHQGASGLPDAVKGQLILATSAAEFSAALLIALKNPVVDIESRKKARSEFSLDRISILVSQIQSDLVQ